VGPHQTLTSTLNPTLTLPSTLTPTLTLRSTLTLPLSLTRTLTLASTPPLILPLSRWDHQTAKSCGGYGCLTRLMSFHATVGIGRGYDLAFTLVTNPNPNHNHNHNHNLTLTRYDLAFTGTNPQTLRLMMPSGAGLASPKVSPDCTHYSITTYYLLQHHFLLMTDD
jgi:hypothetical protein